MNYILSSLDVPFLKGKYEFRCDPFGCLSPSNVVSDTSASFILVLSVVSERLRRIFASHAGYRYRCFVVCIYILFKDSLIT